MSRHCYCRNVTIGIAPAIFMAFGSSGVWKFDPTVLTRQNTIYLESNIDYGKMSLRVPSQDPDGVRRQSNLSWTNSKNQNNQHSMTRIREDSPMSSFVDLKLIWMRLLLPERHGTFVKRQLQSLGCPLSTGQGWLETCTDKPRTRFYLHMQCLYAIRWDC